MKITENIPAFLSIADVDYLSARLLFISGLPIAGMGKAADLTASAPLPFPCAPDAWR